jgi:hypothetical protein
MTNHLTEDQISRWFIGQCSVLEQKHVQNCGACTAELGRFLDTLESFKVAVSTRAETLTRQCRVSIWVCPAMRSRPLQIPRPCGN